MKQIRDGLGLPQSIKFRINPCFWQVRSFSHQLRRLPPGLVNLRNLDQIWSKISNKNLFVWERS